MPSLALLLLSILPQPDGLVRDAVDLVEINAFYDEEVRLVFKQLVFYDWDGRAERFQVRDWRLVKSDFILPRQDWDYGGYVSIWQDGQYERVVRAKFLKETWTQYDPELVEREVLAKEMRIPLAEPKKRVRIKSPREVTNEECRPD